MNKIFYVLIAGPFIILAKIFGFLVWDLFGSDIESKRRNSQPRTYQEQSAYCQQLLRELKDEKRRNNDLHDYYRRKEKKQRDELERQKRREEEYRRKFGSDKN